MPNETNQRKAKRAKEYAINGTCTDEEKHPLKGVRVRVFRVDSLNLTRKVVKEVKTDAAGKFQFENLSAPVPHRRNPPASKEIFYETYYVLAATKPGRASRVNGYLVSTQPTQNVSIQMPAAGTLSGRVIDDKGRPVKGAKVYTHCYPSVQPIEGVLSDTTDADGKYAITDLAVWDVANEKPQKVGENAFEVVASCSFSVRHPEYGTEKPSYTKIPSTVDVTLEPAAVIEGQVIDRKTSKPVANAAVSIQGIHPTNGYQEVKADEQGRYRLTSVAAGKYNIWADAEKRTCIAIDSLEVKAGKTYSNKDITLVEGGWLEGRVTNAKTGKPISEWEGQPLRVAAYGPARPKSGAAVVSAPVDKNGRFGLRVAPGKNFPYIMTWEVWKRTEDFEKFREGIEVKVGELVVLDFKVLEEVPRKKQKFSPVRLSIPVPEEREATAAIRRLGGWYEVDDQKHVVEINMCYHETKDKVRYDNDQAHTDAALQWMPKFPRLKRLYLKEGQAMDKSMRFVAELPELEDFYVWDAHKLSDAGTKHLVKLTKLKHIHISNSPVSDGTLKVFGGLRKLEKLSIQGNHFTDAGVPYLSKLKSLKSLWIGMGKGKLTDKIAPTLAKLTNLDELDLQQIPLTDAGVQKLKTLTKLRQLMLHGIPDDEDQMISDDSVEALMNLKALESLGITNCRMSDESVRKLAALPHLKQLGLNGTPTEITAQTKADLQKKYPKLEIGIRVRSNN